MLLRRIITILLSMLFFGWFSKNVLKYISSDPLSIFRQQEKENEWRNAIAIKNVDIRHYEGTNLLSTAHIENIEISRTRDILEFYKITKGIYYTEDGKNLHFEAIKGNWNSNLRVLAAHEKIHVYHDDFDLTSDSFNYDERLQRLTIPTSIVGKLYQGDIEAYNLVYYIKNKSYTFGPLTWTGYLDDLEKGTDKKQNAKNTFSYALKPPGKEIKSINPGERRKWTIKAQRASRPPGDVEIWTKGQATDGEIVVMGDKLQRNVKTDIIVVTGNVKYYSQDVNMICDKATIYRNEKRAVLEKNIQAIIKTEDDTKLEIVQIEPIRPFVPESIAKTRPSAPAKNEKDDELDKELRSDKSKRKYPILIWVDKVEYWYNRGERRGIFTGHPQARQEFPGNRWRHIWTHKALYDGEKDTLRLESSSGKKETRMRISIGDDLFANWFQISTQEGKEEWEGEGIEGDVFVDSEDDYKEQQ